MADGTEIWVDTDKHPSDANKLLTKLVEDGLLVSNGHGRGTKYLLSDIFHEHEEALQQNSIGIDKNFGEVDIDSDTKSENTGHFTEESNDNIHQTLIELAANARNTKRIKKSEMDEIILQMCSVKALTVKELTELLNRNSDTLRKGYISRLLKESKFVLKYSDNINHPFQAYLAAKL